MSTATLLPRPHVDTRHMPRRRLLLVAYCFPPVGGAGVQRPVKWVKYLHRHGWDVTVLTPSNPSVPAIDHSLEREIPADTAFIRAPTWEPSYHAKQTIAQAAQPNWWSLPQRCVRSFVKSVAKRVLQPDPQILWYHNAVAAATTRMREVPHDAILATAPPYTNLLVGTKLKQRFQLPLLVDYRDEWDLSNQYLENAQRDGWSVFVQERMQRHVLRHADAVVATTQASTAHLATRLRTLQSTATASCIYNGFDADDFSPPVDNTATIPSKPAGLFRLVYTGTLWNLTSVAPVVTAIEQLHEHLPGLVRKLEFVCVGRKTPEQQAVLNRLAATGCRLMNVDYCDHSSAMAWLHSADALCLLLSDVPGAERVVPAKLFEYLAVRKDVLAVLPRGEAADLVTRCHPAGAVAPSDTLGIMQWLVQRLSVGAGSGPADARAIENFSRERQTERLMELLNQLTSSRREH